jgi:hypothetical protein
MERREKAPNKDKRDKRDKDPPHHVVSCNDMIRDRPGAHEQGLIPQKDPA